MFKSVNNAGAVTQIVSDILRISSTTNQLISGKLLEVTYNCLVYEMNLNLTIVNNSSMASVVVAILEVIHKLKYGLHNLSGFL